MQNPRIFNRSTNITVKAGITSPPAKRHLNLNAKGGGGGGGGWYSYFFLIRRLLFTPKKYQQFRHTQKIFEILATPKTYSHSRKSFKMYRNDLNPPPPPLGGTLLFSYIRRLGCLFGVQNFEFQYFWGVSEK